MDDLGQRFGRQYSWRVYGDITGKPNAIDKRNSKRIHDQIGGATRRLVDI
jgi:hypothetical protein